MNKWIKIREFLKKGKIGLITLSSIVIFLAMAGISNSQAATYYVNWDNGSDVTGDGSAGKPWKTPWHADDHIVQGDTVIIYPKRDGSVYYNNGSSVIDAHTSNTTWKAASGTPVWLSVTNDHSSNPYQTCPFCTTISIDAPGITIDGFYVWGSILINYRGDNATIQNCDLSGGGDYQGFPAVIRTTGNIAKSSPPSDWCENLLVRNCKIHDNVPAMPGQGVTNDMLVLTYGAKNVIIENCEFYNSLNSGIKWKDHCNKMTARYNYFHDLPVGIQGDGQYGDDWIDTHNNIFVNISRQAIAPESGAPNHFYVRNNTFYNCYADIGYWRAGINLEIFNNIFYHSTSGQYFTKFDEQWAGLDYNYQDYNNYYSTVTTNWYLNYANRASTLSGWQSYLASQSTCSDCRDARSVGINPNFINSSGAFNLPTDFKRSSYPQNGRGGTWPSVMGAYITGNEVIGVSGGPLPPPDTTPPAPPTNLRIQ